MIPCGALESVFASEMISYTRESPGNFVMSIFLDQLYQNEINDLEIILRIVLLC